MSRMDRRLVGVTLIMIGLVNIWSHTSDKIIAALSDREIAASVNNLGFYALGAVAVVALNWARRVRP